jgi:hypothetical protein
MQKGCTIGIRRECGPRRAGKASQRKILNSRHRSTEKRKRETSRDLGRVHVDTNIRREEQFEQASVESHHLAAVKDTMME